MSERQVDVSNERQLDVWGIYRDPEHVLDALRIIYAARKKLTVPLTIFTNCVSRFTINGQVVERPFGTLVYSKEADIALMLSEAGGYVDTDEEGKDIFLPATARDIMDGFDGKIDLRSEEEKDGDKEIEKIPYRVVFGEYHEEKDDPRIPEIWFARDAEVLQMALDESIGLHTKHIEFNPDDEIELSMGYYVDGEYVELWGVHGKGLVRTDNNWVVIIDENLERNLTPQATEQIVGQAKEKCK